MIRADWQSTPIGTGTSLLFLSPTSQPLVSCPAPRFPFLSLPVQNDTADLAVVGGGAAGLAAAIFAAEAAHSRLRIVVLDGAKTLGAKILVSGGGRCNVTHHEVLPKDFNGSQHIVRNILAAFDVAATIRWFASMGVELKREPTG